MNYFWFLYGEKNRNFGQVLFLYGKKIGFIIKKKCVSGKTLKTGKSFLLGTIVGRKKQNGQLRPVSVG